MILSEIQKNLAWLLMEKSDLLIPWSRVNIEELVVVAQLV